MGTLFNFEDSEQLMSEIGSMRNNLRLMPDFQRREMAANLAMKMAYLCLEVAVMIEYLHFWILAVKFEYLFMIRRDISVVDGNQWRRIR
ncbi:hypothetical protein QYF36_018281 [Acer negundo]|nr:hypothetical protein QYF36_018281 [Acer negundo]